jgi:hypothetical protein
LVEAKSAGKETQFGGDFVMEVIMRQVKNTYGPKKKMMVWVDKKDVEFLERLKPSSITVQSKIRQILTAYREEKDDIGDL